MCIKHHVQGHIKNKILTSQNLFSHKAFRLVGEVDNKIMTERNVCDIKSCVIV